MRPFSTPTQGCEYKKVYSLPLSGDFGHAAAGGGLKTHRHYFIEGRTYTAGNKQSTRQHKNRADKRHAPIRKNHPIVTVATARPSVGFALLCRYYVALSYYMEEQCTALSLYICGNGIEALDTMEAPSPRRLPSDLQIRMPTLDLVDLRMHIGYSIMQ